MAYTLKQLTMAWTAVHDGIEPTGTVLADLQNRAAQHAAGSISDAAILSYVLNSADGSTALAALSYQFFTGKSPTKDGLAYLVNSPTNPNDLNDAYYAKFNLENRYINFAANLGVQGEGAAAFSTKYGALSFADYVASIYETIIGSTYAKAAGIDVAAALAYLTGRYDAIKATAQSAGMITPGMTAAQIDLAVKAAAAGFLLGEAIKADVGLYAGAANNFMLALAEGKAVYNTDITATYKPSEAQGTGQPVTTVPPVDTMPGYVPPPPPPPPPPPSVYAFILTAGNDTFTGAGLGDTFTATDTTFNAGDVLKGGGGNDTLNVSGGVVGGYTLAAATLNSIETVNITNTVHGVTVDASGWADVTKLNVTGRYGNTVTAAATTDVTFNSLDQGGSTVTINGGHDVSVTAANGSGVLRIGQTTAPTGAVTVVRSPAVATGGASEVVVGTSLDLTLQPGTYANFSTSWNPSTITGTALTTSLKVKGSKQIDASSTVAGQGGTYFLFNDVNRNSTTAVGTITTLDIDGFISFTFDGTGLTTLKASHGNAGGITIANGAAVPGRATTLNLSLNDVQTTGDLVDSGGYTTLNVTTGAIASSFNSLTMSAVTALNVSGSSVLEFAAIGASALQTITVTGAAGLTMPDLSGIASLTELDAHGASGAIKTTVDASVTKVSTGSGADTIYTDGNTISKAISLGAGDDFLSLAAVTTITATVDGGNGTDTIFLDGVDAASPATGFAAHVQNFERLYIDNANNYTVDLTALGGFHYVTAEDGNGATIDGFSAGDTLALAGAGTSYTIGSANFGGANDSFNVVLTSAGSQTFGRLDSTGIETIALTVNDSAATATNTHTWRATDTALKTLTVTGNGQLNLTLDSTHLTSVDASALTISGLYWTTGALVDPVTIKGSSTADNYVDASNAIGVITYQGGSDDDYVKIGAGGGTVQAGNGDNVVFALSNNASTITTGSGDDNIFVGGGANVVNVGSGNDYVGINAATASSSAFTTINGMGAGDKVEFSSLTFAQTTAGAAVANLAAATAGDGSGGALLKWFVSGGDTYIVVDNSLSASFVDGVDYIVKLTGVHNLNVAGNVSSFAVTLH